MVRLLPPLLAAALALAGCGGDDDPERAGGPLTVYSSLPPVGVSSDEADAVEAGVRLALEDARNRAGGHDIKLVALESSDTGDPAWDPDSARSNADEAADDPSAVAYIGELDLGGSAVSVPETNGAGLLQVAPLDGLTALTRRQPGARTGPERFYPSGERNFMRLAPNDLMQAQALVAWMRDEGARSVAVFHDDRVFGRELASQVAAAATDSGVELTGVDALRANPEGYEDVVRDLAQRPPEAVLYTGITPEVAGPFYDAVQRALPDSLLFGSSGVAGVNFDSRARVRVLKPGRPPRAYPRSGRRVLARLDGETGGNTPVEALYGYEAMRLVLDAIDRNGSDADRASVANSALEPRAHRGVIGDYRVTTGGDVSEERFGGYMHDGEALRFAELRSADGPAGR